MRVALLGALPGRRHQGPVAWGGHNFEVLPGRFHDFARFLSPRRERLMMDRPRLDALRASLAGFELVISESPEVVALHQEWRRRGERAPGLLSLDVRALSPVAPLRAWYREHHREDPWPHVTADPRVRWVVNHPSLLPPLRRGGVAPERIEIFPSSTAVFSLALPDAAARLDGDRPRDTSGGEILVAGSAERDHALALRLAARLPALPFSIVAERRRVATETPSPPNLRWQPPVPLEDYIELLRGARLVLVLLEPGPVAAGQLTVALAHRLGTPLVCSEVAGVRDYVHADDTLLVPPGDEERLTRAVGTLWDDAGLRAALAAGGRRAEAARVAAFEAGLRRTLAAFAGGS